MSTSHETIAIISEALQSEFQGVVQWYAQRGRPLNRAPKGAWTAHEHLDHLILSTKPLNMALRLPKSLLGIRFGKSKAASRSFDDVVDQYTHCLAQGGKATGPYIPTYNLPHDATELTDAFRQEGDRLEEVLTHWSEAQVDKYRLPHPLLGKLTVREMLYFTLYHTRHHLETLKRNYT